MDTPPLERSRKDKQLSLSHTEGQGVPGRSDAVCKDIQETQHIGENGKYLIGMLQNREGGQCVVLKSILKII